MDSGSGDLKKKKVYIIKIILNSCLIIIKAVVLLVIVLSLAIIINQWCLFFTKFYFKEVPINYYQIVTAWQNYSITTSSYFLFQKLFFYDLWKIANK